MLVCPPYTEETQERLAAWRASVRAFIDSEAMSDLLGYFDCRPTKTSLYEKIEQIRSFIGIRWNYRGGSERWTVADRDPVVERYYWRILACAGELGLIGIKSSRRDADYLLPLGGARTANHDRMKEARRLRDLSQRPVPVAALAAMRPVSEIEIPCIRGDLPEARAGVTTEYDVMCRALDLYFPKEGRVFCAPDKEPGRRANTFDTFRYFCDREQPPRGSVLLFTTSSIYINYQTAALMPLAMERGLELVFSGSGTPGAYDDVVSNYLQEIKGTIDALSRDPFLAASK